MSKELTKIQIQAIEKFSKLKVGALFMKMGTGKTRAALEIVNNVKPDFLLYLTPVSTKKNIEEEINKWGCCCPYEIIGYESIASSDRIFAHALSLVNNDKSCFLIADESIFIKRKSTKRFKRSIELRNHCEYALILNGTPITRNEFDLIAQMDFLSYQILPRNSFDIVETFFEEHHIRKNGVERTFYTFYEGNRPLLMKLCEPYIYQADLVFEKEEDEDYRWCYPTESELYHYNDIKFDTSYLADNYESYILMLLGKCQEYVACLESKNEEVANYIRNKRIICFCNYIKEIECISSMVDCYVITGSTPLKERHRIIQEFKKSNKPLVMSLGVGSYSLNLQFCDEIVYSSITYNYSQLEQSKYRIKRNGQENDILYTYILSNLGINQLILKNLDKKISLDSIIREYLQEKKIEELLEKL